MAKKIDCGSSCFLRRKGCKDIRQCACDCAALKAININLYDACVTACNGSDRPEGEQDFLCNFVGGETLFNQYGLLQCGYTIGDSLQFQAYDIQQQDELQATSDEKKTTSYIIYALIGILALAILNFMFNR